MRLLLDAQTLLWWVTGPTRLSATARDAITTTANVIAVGIGSLWEIAVKRELGQLDFPVDFEEMMADENFSLLAVTYAHLRVLERLPQHHRDPFDRLLIAQAISEGIPIVSADSVLARYDVRTLW